MVHATMLKQPKTDSQLLKSVLPALRKALIAKTAERTDRYSNVTKKLISNIHREALIYRNKCEEMIRTVTGGSLQSADIVRSLLEDP